MKRAYVAPSGPQRDFDPGLTNIAKYLYKTCLMKSPFVISLLCFAVVAGISGCGGDNATSSETQESSPATTAEREGNGKSEARPLEAQASKVVIGDYEREGPFSAVAGGNGNEKPRFDPSGQPTPKKVVTRELEVGSGPAAQRGDEVSVYYAGALYETGKVELYAWPPTLPPTFKLGFSAFGRSWEKAIEGMKLGGMRQVIIPESEWAEEKPVDYVIVLTALQPK